MILLICFSSKVRNLLCKCLRSMASPLCNFVLFRSRDTEASVKRMESSVKEDQAMLKKLKEEEAKHSAAIDKDQEALSSAHDVIEESRSNHELKNKEVSNIYLHVSIYQNISTIQCNVGIKQQINSRIALKSAALCTFEKLQSCFERWFLTSRCFGYTFSATFTFTFCN